MAQAWPTAVPDSPLLEGYTSSRDKTKLVSNVDAGLRKFRNRYRAAATNKTETFVFTNAQKVAFENFYNNALDGGAERFIRKNPETGINSEYRFQGESEPTYEVMGWGKNGATWRVTIQVELMP